MLWFSCHRVSARPPPPCLTSVTESKNLTSVIEPQAFLLQKYFYFRFAINGIILNCLSRWLLCLSKILSRDWSAKLLLFRGRNWNISILLPWQKTTTFLIFSRHEHHHNTTNLQSKKLKCSYTLKGTQLFLNTLAICATRSNSNKRFFVSFVCVVFFSGTSHSVRFQWTTAWSAYLRSQLVLIITSLTVSSEACVACRRWLPAVGRWSP